MHLMGNVDGLWPVLGQSREKTSRASDWPNMLRANNASAEATGPLDVEALSQ